MDLVKHAGLTERILIPNFRGKKFEAKEAGLIFRKTFDLSYRENQL